MKYLLATLALAAGLALPAGAATIVNGSFEDHPDVGGNTWNVFSAIPGWYTTGGPGIEIQTNPTLGSIDAQDGDSYVELDSYANSAMAQDVYFGIGQYLLSFYYSPRNDNSDDNVIDYGVSGGLLSGSLAGPSVVPATAVGVWTKITSLFNVTTAGTYQVTFAASGIDNSLGGFVDNVTIAAVPVPAAGFMLFGALAGLGALRRRNPKV